MTPTLYEGYVARQRRAEMSRRYRQRQRRTLILVILTAAAIFAIMAFAVAPYAN